MLGPAPSPPKRGAARCATGQFLLTISAIALLAGIHNVVSINLVAQCLNPAEAAGATSLGAPFAGGLRAEIRRRLGIGGAEDARVAFVAVLAPPATSRRPVAARATSHAALPPARVGSSAAAQRLAQLVAPSNILLMSSVSSRAADEARMQARALARALARGAEGGASSSEGGPRALGSGGASAALPADRFTTQTCYFQTDESEVRRAGVVHSVRSLAAVRRMSSAVMPMKVYMRSSSCILHAQDILTQTALTLSYSLPHPADLHVRGRAVLRRRERRGLAR